MGVNGRPNGDPRPSAARRRANRYWLLDAESGFGGNGITVPCVDCGTPVSYATMYVDRIVRGEHGGRYVRGNIQPHCCPCSGRQGQTRTTELRAQRSRQR